MSGLNVGETAIGIYAPSSSAYFTADVEMLEILIGRCVECVTIFTFIG